jgi:Asp-tRNA(Asn)/Glu-tRNA(Gln) amidotransferase A subunit family amidase
VFYPLHIPTPSELKDHEASASKHGDINVAASLATSTKDKGFKFLTANDYVANYKSGKWTPTFVVNHVMQAIAKSESASPALRAFVAINFDEAIAEAERSTARYANKKSLGPLDGVPFAVKCEMDVKGFNTTLGTSFWGKYNGVASQDVVAVARMKAQGAIMTGILNMHEIGIGAIGHNAVYGL